MKALIEARAVSFTPARAGRGAAALVDAVDFAAGAGEVTVIVGPNGAGKSTLLKLLCGELKATRGDVLVEGRPLAAMPAWRLACRRAVLPQASTLAFPFTAQEVARLGVEGIGRGLSRPARERLVAEALERADAAHLAGRLYQALSGGEQQRVQFARVLAQLAAGRTVEAQQILFLDEPVASLDLKHQLALLREARALAAAGLAIVAVLHDLQLAAACADALVVLHRGRAVARGAPTPVLSRAILAEVFEVGVAGETIPPTPWQAIERASSDGRHDGCARRVV